MTRGRLSVQRVEEECWHTIELLAEKGGWDPEVLKKGKAGGKGRAKAGQKDNREEKQKEYPSQGGDDDENRASEHQKAAEDEQNRMSRSSQKRKAKDTGEQEHHPRRSARAKK